MVRRNVTYAQLADRLAAIGFDDNERSLRNKVSPGKIHRRVLAPMADRNRGRAHTAVSVFTATALFLLWSFFIWELSENNTQYNKYADHYASEYAENAQKDLREACPSGDIRDLAECISRYLEAQRDDYRDEQDLKAQQKMADWALGMLIGSALTLAATGIGAYFVWLSLRITRVAISDDREIGEAQVRAYITAGPESLIVNEYAPIAFNPIRVLNNGTSPARKVIVFSEMFVGPLHYPSSLQPRRSHPSIGLLQATIPAGKQYATYEAEVIGDPISWDSYQRAISPGGDSAIYIYIYITYCDVFKKPHWTECFLMLDVRHRTEKQGVGVETRNVHEGWLVAPHFNGED